MHDRFGRPLRSLRISVTDRCNLRCSYCMPEETYDWLPRKDLLSFEELTAVVRASAELGVDRVRITGGEPLIRRNLPAFVEQLSHTDGVRDVALTTNGVFLAEHATTLAQAGLHRVTVSLDSLDPSRFRELTGRDLLPRVLDGLRVAAKAGFKALKLNTVVLSGINDRELGAMLDLARELGAEARFIEYMDVGGATRWRPLDVVSRDEILERISETHGPSEPLEASSAPARRYRLRDGTVFGIIASTTTPFCQTCDRLRLTADGVLYTCLYAREGVPLRAALRAGEDMTEFLRGVWSGREDRGAEERLRLEASRLPLAGVGELRENPHLEMHTRGG